MDFFKTKSKFDDIAVRRDNLKAEMQSLLRSILVDLPEKKIVFRRGSPAYSNVEGPEYWVELPVYGVRLDENGVISFSMEESFTDKFDVKHYNASFVPRDTAYADNIDVNWFSILSTVVDTLEAERGEGGK